MDESLLAGIIINDPEMEQRICGILLSLSYCKKIYPKRKRSYDNLELTELGEKVFGSVEVEDEFVNSFMYLFPKDNNSSKNVVKKRLKTFFKRYETSKERLIVAAKYWNDKYTGQYAGTDINFLYKTDKDGTTSSRAMDVIKHLYGDE